MTADQEPRNDGHAESANGPTSSGLESTTEVELRHRLNAIADRHSPKPQWSEVVDRAEGDGVVPLRTGDPGRPFVNRSLAVAAALLVVVGAVGVFLTTRADDGQQVVSGPGPDGSGDDVIDTGWYIPSPLPDGWTVTSIEASPMTLVGPGTLVIWVSPDESASLAYASEPLDGGSPADWGGTPVQLTPEIEGYLQGAEGPWPNGIVWAAADQLRMVNPNGVAPDDVTAAAKALALGVSSDLSPVDGMELFGSWDRTYTSRDTVNVSITLESDYGEKVGYDLFDPGDYAMTFLLAAIPVRRQIDGQPLPLVEARALDLATDLSPYLLGRWPGSDVLLPSRRLSLIDGVPQSLVTPSEEATMALVRSLRPATAEQWREFLRDSGLDVDPSLLSAARLEDLSAAPEGDESVSTTAQHGPGGPTTTPQMSSALVEPWPEEALALFDHSPNPQVWTAAFGGEGPVRSGTPFSLAPMLTNRGDERFDVHECTVLGTTIGILPVGTNQKVPRPDISGCDPTRLMFSIEPQGTADWPLPPLYADGIPTREIRSGPAGTYLGGTLAPGEYQMFVSFALQSGINKLFSPATITEHPCGGFTTEFVDRFMGKTPGDAAAEADRLGFNTRVAELDGVSQATTDDHRCDRVDLAVADGRVVAVVDVG